VPIEPSPLPRRGPRAALAAGAIAALALIVAAPWTAHRGYWIAPFLYAIFDPVCHQIAQRSFHLWGEPLAVCHRCAGLYLGFALGVMIWPAFPTTAARLLAKPRAILLFSIPLATDAVLFAGVNTAASRFTSGIVAAFPIALLAHVAVAQLSVRGVGAHDEATTYGNGARA
jgi:uncharacterized membrane protein